MASKLAYTVLTEFKFEVGNAMVGASSLQSGLNKVSNAAKDAQYQLARVGVGFLTQMGLGAGGVLGTVASIVRGYSAMESAQNKLATQLFAQKGYFTGINSTNDALKQSSLLLKKIGKDAQTFGLDEGIFAAASNVNIGMLGSAGVSPSQSVDFTRNMLKAAPSLGIDPGSLQQQTADILSGSLSQNSRAEQRLFAETDVFKDFIKKNKTATAAIKKFNKEFTPHERFDMLNTAFEQFTSNTELLKKQAKEIGRMFKSIRNSLFGFNGVFMGLGESIVPLIQEALSRFLSFVDGPFRKIMENATAVFKQIIPKFDLMLVRLQEISDVSRNFQAAGIGAVVLQIGHAIGQFLLISRLTGGIELTAIISGMTKFFSTVGGFKGLGKQLLIFLRPIGKILMFLGRGLLAFAKPLLILFAVFSLFSRASAFAKVEDMKKLPKIFAKLSDTAAIFMSVLGILIKPFQEVFDWFAKLISPLFQTSYLLDAVAGGFDKLTTVLVDFLGMLSGLTNILVIPFAKALDGNFMGAMKEMSFENMSKNFSTGRDDFFRSVLSGAGRDDAGNLLASGTTQNLNGPITIKQEFKEKFEPDRIAFSTTEALRKLGQNATRGKVGGTVRSTQ